MPDTAALRIKMAYFERRLKTELTQSVKLNPDWKMVDRDGLRELAAHEHREHIDRMHKTLDGMNKVVQAWLDSPDLVTTKNGGKRIRKRKSTYVDPRLNIPIKLPKRHYSESPTPKVPSRQSSSEPYTGEEGPGYCVKQESTFARLGRLGPATDTTPALLSGRFDELKTLLALPDSNVQVKLETAADGV